MSSFVFPEAIGMALRFFVAVIVPLLWAIRLYRAGRRGRLAPLYRPKHVLRMEDPIVLVVEDKRDDASRRVFAPAGVHVALAPPRPRKQP